jgi:hypothetical protein
VLPERKKWASDHAVQSNGTEKNCKVECEEHVYSVAAAGGKCKVVDDNIWSRSIMSVVNKDINKSRLAKPSSNGGQGHSFPTRHELGREMLDRHVLFPTLITV